MTLNSEVLLQDTPSVSLVLDPINEPSKASLTCSSVQNIQPRSCTKTHGKTYPIASNQIRLFCSMRFHLRQLLRSRGLMNLAVERAL